MTTADLINLLDETIDGLTEPLFERHAAGDKSARDTVRQLGLHLLDRGCSIVARSGLPLAGLDAAVVAAQDRAHAISAEQSTSTATNNQETANDLGGLTERNGRHPRLDLGDSTESC